MKKTYITPELVIETFDDGSIIACSGEWGGEGGGEWSNVYEDEEIDA